MKEKHDRCLVCNSTAISPLNNYYERHGLVQCSDCSFVFMERIPTLKELDDHYSTYAYGRAADLSPVTIKSYHQLLDEFEAYRQNGRILDVGCGRGWFLEEAKKRGWEVFGTEYSTTAIDICQEKGIQMQEGALQVDMFESGYFDVITSFEVIEHINNPHEDMGLIAHFLRKGGLFYCTTPNFNAALRRYLKADYHVINYPEHLSYYTQKTLNKVVEAHNLHCDKFLSTGISVTALKKAKPVTAKPSASTSTTQKSAVSADEALRLNIDKKFYLKWAKSVTNQLLTWTNLGSTLKGYYVKK